jgi:hypothetical protein
VIPFQATAGQIRNPVPALSTLTTLSGAASGARFWVWTGSIQARTPFRLQQLQFQRGAWGRNHPPAANSVDVHPHPLQCPRGLKSAPVCCDCYFKQLHICSDGQAWPLPTQHRQKLPGAAAGTGTLLQGQKAACSSIWKVYLARSGVLASAWKQLLSWRPPQRTAAASGPKRRQCPCADTCPPHAFPCQFACDFLAYRLVASTAMTHPLLPAQQHGQSPSRGAITTLCLQHPPSAPQQRNGRTHSPTSARSLQKQQRLALR